MKHLMRHIMMIAIALGFLYAIPAQAKTKSCYANAYDADGDGYAREGATATDVQVGSTDLNCPHGYRGRAGDCNDFNAAVHPRTREIGYNRRDDDCNGLVDEPTVAFNADGLHNHSNSIDIYFKLNHQEIWDAAAAGKLEVRVRRFSLVTSSTTVDRYFTAPAISYTPGYYTGMVTLNNLTAGTVFAVRLAFFRKEVGADPVDIGPNGDIKGDGTGAEYDMERFYTMTDSPVSSVHNRFLTVMRGLGEYYASQDGEVGYWGSERADGRRYGADGNEKWCSEFYVWVTRRFVEDISGTTVEDLMDFFGERAELHTAQDVQVGSPGDYLPLDTDENGDLNHSAMFLAYDPGASQVWTLEGNWSNEVVVNKRFYSYPLRLGDGNVFRRLGHIKNSMWK